MLNVDDIISSVGRGQNSQPPASIEAPQGPAASSSEEPVAQEVETLSDDDFDEIIDNWHNEVNTSASTDVEEPDTTVSDDINSSEVPDDSPEEQDTQEEPAQEEQESVSDSLPENSPTLLVDETTSRFSGAMWYDEIRKTKVIVAGLGGIGSHLAVQISRLSPDLMVLYDSDTVEAGNLSGQFYGRSYIGINKANAISSIIREYSSRDSSYSVSENFTNATEAGDIMMCGFDNMTARKVFFNSWKHHVLQKPIEDRKKCLFLDGRLSLSVLQVYCIRGDDDYNMEKYKKDCLFSSDEADLTVCSMKQTTYMASLIGGIMTNLFVNHIANTLNPAIPYSLPFFTEYDSTYMIFKTTD